VKFLTVRNETNVTVSGAVVNKTKDDVHNNWHEDLGKGLHDEHNVNSTGYNYNGTAKGEVVGQVVNQTDKDPDDFGNIHKDPEGHFNYGKGAYRTALTALKNGTNASNTTVSGAVVNKTKDDIHNNWHEDLGKGLHDEHNVNSTGYNYNGTAKGEVVGQVVNQTDKDPDDFGNIHKDPEGHFNYGKGAYRTALTALRNETNASNTTVSGAVVNKTKDDIHNNWHEDLGKGLHDEHNVNSTGYNYNGTAKGEVVGQVVNQTDKDPDDFGNIHKNPEDHFNYGKGAYRSK
jgi:hypothetical protein